MYQDVQCRWHAGTVCVQNRYGNKPMEDLHNYRFPLDILEWLDMTSLSARRSLENSYSIRGLQTGYSITSCSMYFALLLLCPIQDYSSCRLPLQRPIIGPQDRNPVLPRLIWTNNGILRFPQTGMSAAKQQVINGITVSVSSAFMLQNTAFAPGLLSFFAVRSVQSSHPSSSFLIHGSLFINTWQ